MSDTPDTPNNASLMVGGGDYIKQLEAELAAIKAGNPDF